MCFPTSTQWEIFPSDVTQLLPIARKDEEAEFFQIADGDMRAWEDENRFGPIRFFFGCFLETMTPKKKHSCGRFMKA